VTAYQLTINNGDSFGYDLEVLYDCDICPEIHLMDILAQVYRKLESFGVVFVGLNMERGTHAHMHAYVQLTYKPTSMAAWQKMFPGVHVEPCRGTPEQNMDYLAKAGKWENDEKHGTLKWGPLTYGEMVGIGRGCPEDYIKLAECGKSYVEIVRAYPDSLRYSWGIRSFCNDLASGSTVEKA